MIAPNREDTTSPLPIAPAPDGAGVPLPSTFQLVMSPGTVALDAGSVLMGGSPLRLQRLSARAVGLLEHWKAGAPVGERRSEQLLARRLVSAGMCFPRPTESSRDPDDVTVVIPVRDRPDQLCRLLASLDGLACVVVDDASADPRRNEAIARTFGAHFIDLERNLGPAGARNAGWAGATTPLVAFVDSDCEPSRDWLAPLLGYFDDPMVAAVAPRIVPGVVDPPTWLSRYEEVRSPLDRGATEGLVRPFGAIPFVPAAALVVRRSVAGASLFDPALQGGEDVDAVWRLVAAGWDVRFVPAATVAHTGPTTARTWLSRRAFYGTTAGPLARRHPDALSPVNTSVWSAATWLLLVTRRPVLAAGVLGDSVLTLAQRLERLVDDPLAVAGRIAGGGTAKSALPALSGLARAWSPALAIGLLFRRTRRGAALALVIPALHHYAADPGELDPARYVAAHVADDLAYGAGLWRGCLQSRTLRPLLPRIALRSRVWSVSALRGQLKRNEGEMNEGKSSGNEGTDSANEGTEQT